MEIVTKTDMSKVTADLIMDKSGIQIFNLDDDIKVDTPFNTIESIAAIYRDSLEFYSHDIKYRFKFLPKEHTSFVLFLETLYSFTEKA